jgi:hypothetical protein
MKSFQVRLIQEGNPEAWQRVEAVNEKQAAEQLNGTPLADFGPPRRLRALVRHRDALRTPENVF